MEEKDTLNERLALVEQYLQDLAEQIRIINIAVSRKYEDSASGRWSLQYQYIRRF